MMDLQDETAGSPVGAGKQLLGVVAEVNEAANARTESRVRQHQAIAAKLERLAPDLIEVMEEPLAEGAKASRAIRELRDFLQAEANLRKITAFVVENEALFETSTREVFDRFTEWLPVRAVQLRAARHRYREQYSQWTRDNRDELKKLADAWSVCDGDGLNGH